MSDGLNMSRRIRRTPYTDRVEAAGVRGFSVVNHMLLPKAFQATVEEDYWHLKSDVQIWDVSCQRQVQLHGPDAAHLLQLMTPRDIGKAQVGDCLYLPIIDERAGLINDPVMLKLAEDRFWLSIADSDVLLYAKGLALGFGLDVDVREPDVSPLAIQGPKARQLMQSVFGERIGALDFFKFAMFDFEGTGQLIARSGYSRQGGFEIYLQDSSLGGRLWDRLWEAGAAFNIRPGCPNLIERIEGGLLSYGNEFTALNNPLEIGLGKYCTLDGSVDFIGLAALQKIAANGPSRLMRGVVFDGGKCPTCVLPWPLKAGDRQIGEITSAIWSPRLMRNVGLSFIDRGYWDSGQALTVTRIDGVVANGEVADLPIK